LSAWQKVGPGTCYRLTQASPISRGRGSNGAFASSCRKTARRIVNAHSRRTGCVRRDRHDERAAVEFLRAAASAESRARHQSAIAIVAGLAAAPRHQANRAFKSIPDRQSTNLTARETEPFCSSDGLQRPVDNCLVHFKRSSSCICLRSPGSASPISVNRVPRSVVNHSGKADIST
jgi:hypothetical protein